VFAIDNKSANIVFTYLLKLIVCFSSVGFQRSIYLFTKHEAAAVTSSTLTIADSPQCTELLI